MRGGWAIAVAAVSTACQGAGPPASDAGFTRDAALDRDGSTDAGLLPQGPFRHRLLYLADQIEDDVFELFLVRLNDAGERIVDRISEPLDGRSVRSFEASAQGQWVSYLLGHETFAVKELFAARIGEDGPEPAVRLNGPLAGPASDVAVASFAPNEAWIVYLADQDTDGLAELYAVDLRGGTPSAPVKISGDPSRLAYANFVWSPDGTMLLFRADTSPGRTELFWVDFAGTTPSSAQIVSALRPTGDPDVEETDATSAGYAWSPDSSRFFYRADQEAENVVELYVVDLDQGAPTAPQRVNNPLPDGSVVDEAVWSPDASHLMFRAGPIPGPMQCFVVDFAGGAPSSPLTLAARCDRNPIWSPDSTRVTFAAPDGPQAGAPVQWFAAPVSGPAAGQAVQLSQMTALNSKVEPASIGCPSPAWSPDSRYVAFAADDDDFDFRADLWMVDLSSGAPSLPARVNGPLSGGMHLADCPTPWSPAASTLIYRSNELQLDREQLMAVGVDSLGSPVRASGTLGLEGNVQFVSVTDRTFTWSPTGEWIAYLADQEINEHYEVFLVSPDLLGTSIRANDTLYLPGDVLEFRWMPTPAP